MGKNILKSVLDYSEACRDEGTNTGHLKERVRRILMEMGVKNKKVRFEVSKSHRPLDKR